MALLEIPPYVLADEDPPGSKSSVRGFRQPSYRIVEPVEFPRALFGAALEEHRRLLDAHGSEVLEAPFDHPGKEPADRFVARYELARCTTLLVVDGAAHEVHRWRTVDASFVVPAYRGVVRRLMEVPAEGTTYVIVIAGGVVSLQLVRPVPPRRAGERATLEVVARDLVVEPRQQWHRRDLHHVTTWWTTPAGEDVVSRVPVHPWPRTQRAVAEALLTIRGASVRERLAEYAKEWPGDSPLAVVDTDILGEELDVCDRRERGIWLAAFPAIDEALRLARPGLIPVLIPCYRWAALAWFPVDPGTDIAVPRLLVEQRTPQAGDRDETDAPAPPPPKPRIPPSLEKQTLAVIAAFSPTEPWAPRAVDVHAVWLAGLSVAVYAALLAVGSWLVLGELPHLGGRRLALGGAALAVAALLVWFSVVQLRSALRRVDPVRRKGDWETWKQWKALEEARKPPPPDPAAEHRRDWTRRLAERLNRLARLVDLDAPEEIIGSERRMIHEAIAELTKTDAHAVLAAWPRAARLLATPEERRAARGTVKAKDKPN